MLNAAVIGLGWWGKTIVRTLEESAKLRVVRAVDRDPKAADWAAERGLRASTDLRRRARPIPGVDAVILCTPHSLHTAQIAAGRGGQEACILREAAGARRADVEESIAACATPMASCSAVGHERRFEPPMLEMRRLVAAGELGTMLQIEANFSQDKFLTLAARQLAAFRRATRRPGRSRRPASTCSISPSACSGPAERAFAVARRLGSNLANGDTLAALVSFKSGATSAAERRFGDALRRTPRRLWQ